MSETLSIQYPRRVFLRRILKLAGRVAGAVLARPNIKGLENLPANGPLIIVGNHAAFVEVAMMGAYTPYPLEMMGAGDIPLDPRYAWLADLYGFIRIKRGSMDREGLTLALDVLKQNGVVGLFPEGGIWENTLRQARTGVAWLSSKANAPIIPIGFWGIEGALTKLVRLKRPRINMRVGKLIPPIDVNLPGVSRKQALNQGANLIMERITELIPEDERRIRKQTYVGEDFDFKLIVTQPDGSQYPVPEELNIKDKRGLSKFYHRPVMLDVFTRNLRLPVMALNQIDRAHEPIEIASAVQAILDYLATNPYFFEYRFGQEEGEAMERGLVQLRDTARWLAEHKPAYTLQVKPIRRYTLIDTQEEVIEEAPPPIPEI